MTDRPMPPALAKAGLRTLVENLPPGAGLAIARDFVRVFRPEIEARLRRQPEAAPCAASDNSTCR